MATSSLMSNVKPSVKVLLHPLVIMHMSEHWTRICAQQGRLTQVYGALLGQQTGRVLELMNAFELVTKPGGSDGEVIVDMEYFHMKDEQFKQVFSKMEFLGWYTSGGEVCRADIKTQQQICLIHETPIFLKFDPNSTTSELPINLYESVIDAVAGEPTMLFVQLPYTLATEDSERIGIDHVAKISAGTTDTQSAASQQILTIRSAVKMLKQRMELIGAYLKAVHSGELDRNEAILRDIAALCNSLPVMEGPGFDCEFYTQYNDVALISLLASLTKSCDTINQFVTKFNVVHERHSVSRRGRGPLF